MKIKVKTLRREAVSQYKNGLLLQELSCYGVFQYIFSIDREVRNEGTESALADRMW